MGLPEDAIEHVKVIRDSDSEDDILKAMDALVGMLPMEFSYEECARWASTVWDYTPDPLSVGDIETARDELTRLAQGGGHLTWDDDG